MTKESHWLTKLIIQNVRRWRWRLLTIGTLICLALSLFLLYGGLIAVSTSSGLARIEAIDIPYFDMLIILKADQKAIDKDDLPTPAYGRKILNEQETATILNVSGSFGTFRLLETHKDSLFFQFTEDDLVGHKAQNENEIVLPMQLAEKGNLTLGDKISISYSGTKHLSTWEVELVGIYKSDTSLLIALTSGSYLTGLTKDNQANSILLTIDHTTSTLESCTEWMMSLYPSATMISNHLPMFLGKSMLDQAYQPSYFIIVLVFLFMGVGILTIALITFLERRKEISILKAIGITNKHIVYLLGCEYGLTEVAGLLMTIGVFLFFRWQISWFNVLSNFELLTMIINGVVISIVVLCMSLIYPVLLAKVATVQQLLFSRTIPLQVNEYDHLLIATSDLVYREVEENVHIVRVPFDNGQYDCMLFKQIGDIVKKGEVIASQERSQGHFIHNYLSPCDGVVIEMNGALVVIKPDDPNTPHYPYPKQLIEDEKHRQSLLERVRNDERKLLESGSSSTALRKSGMLDLRKKHEDE